MQILLLLLGVFACSMSVIFIKNSNIEPVLLSGLRLAVAVVVLAPLYFYDWRRHREKLTWGHLRDSAVPGVVLALHFISWIYGARLTPAVNSTLIVNVVPVVMPMLLWLLVNERLTAREWLATGVVSLGLAVLFAADYQLEGSYFYGDAVCFASMFLLAVYLAMGRRYRHHPTVWLYLVPLYAAAGAVCLAAGAFTADWSAIDWRKEALPVLGLGLVPTVVGHSLINNAMRHLRGQVVSLFAMSQFIFAGVAAYFLLGEYPDWGFYPASVAVVVGGVIAATGRKNGSDESAEQEVACVD